MVDNIRVAKVENVMLQRGSHQLIPGTFHLMAHHLMFCPTSSDQEIWICYSSINNVDRRFTNTQGLTPVHVACRHFLFVRFLFTREQDAQDVFLSLQKLINISLVENLYAFQFKLPENQVTGKGWSVFNPEVEFGRMGVGTKNKAWRLTTVNQDFTFCSTYPRILGVPSRISDNVLKHAVKFRSKGRIPVLSYIHRTNMVSITRSAQPLVGLKQNRSIQDEKLVESIFQTGDCPAAAGNLNLIIDARPQANAIAQTALGAGTENMENYRGCRLAFSGIENIHVMRDSITKLMEAIQSSESGSSLRSALDKSGWLKHVKGVMEGASMIVQNVHILNNPVLVHCSDGWDRTAQLCSLSEMCLDPYYRTFKGFQVLIEKEWVSFGHKFRDRLGLLTKEGRDGTERPSMGAQIQAASKNVGFSITSAAKNLLKQTSGNSSASTVSTYSTSYYNSPSNGYQSSYGASSGPQGSAEVAIPNTVHPKEVSPVFTQFLDCAYQLWTQFPTHFEFNEKFLIAVNTHIHSCQFGNFLFNCEKDRLGFVYRKPGGGPPLPLDKATSSIWDYFDANKDEFLNPLYISPEKRKEEMQSSETNATRGAGTGSVGSGAGLGAPGTVSEDGEVLFPSSTNLRYWVGMLFKGEEDYVDSEIGNPTLDAAGSASASGGSTRGAYGALSASTTKSRPSATSRTSSTSLSAQFFASDPSASSSTKLFPPQQPLSGAAPSQYWSASGSTLNSDAGPVGATMVESITMGMNSLATQVKSFAATVDFNPWGAPASSSSEDDSSNSASSTLKQSSSSRGTAQEVALESSSAMLERRLQNLAVARANADASKEPLPGTSEIVDVVDLDDVVEPADEEGEEEFRKEELVVPDAAAAPAGKPLQINDLPHPLWVPGP
ncbi:hypothetical protein HDU97_000026 [Phlyctochytrium planicorne]|nr:hypothetical protein HDU97_000026 [Phlyctochytrium planicorne]